MEYFDVNEWREATWGLNSFASSMKSNPANDKNVKRKKFKGAI